MMTFLRPPTAGSPRMFMFRSMCDARDDATELTTLHVRIPLAHRPGAQPRRDDISYAKSHKDAMFHGIGRR
jgi:hypothetical protein